MDNIEFKREIAYDFIPRIERMLKDEEAHLKYLQNHAYNKLVDTFISNSIAIVDHLKVRLSQYKEYVK